MERYIDEASYVAVISRFVHLYVEIIHEALASGLTSMQVDEPWYNYFIPHASWYTLRITRYYMLMLIRVV